MIESSKSSSAGADKVYVSPWKFYESLEFLSDAFTPRKIKSNTNEKDDGSPYADAKPPSAKTSKKLALAQNNARQGQLASIVHTPAPLQQSPFAAQQNSMPPFASPQSPFSSLSFQQSYSISSGSFGY